MREIKFRVWNKQVGVWRYLTLGMDGCPELPAAIFARESVGQFTGLLDKNGKEIYEGDIVRFFDPTSGKYSCGEVIFKISHAYGYVGFCIDGKSSTHNNLLAKDEIIGNIYENPELLKEAPHGE